jgi:hypothetical protein
LLLLAIFCVVARVLADWRCGQKIATMTIDAEWNFLARVLYIQASRFERCATSLKITAQIDSQTANTIAICD